MENAFGVYWEMKVTTEVFADNETWKILDFSGLLGLSFVVWSRPARLTIECDLSSKAPQDCLTLINKTI
jgi:hypothetical protein